MTEAFQFLNDLKCLTCIHFKICGQNLGGLDLTIAASNCQNYDNIQGFVPLTKFWRIFDVPGFYEITEYEVEQVVYTKGQITQLCGHAPRSQIVVSPEEFGDIVFFSREAAEVALAEMIKKG